MIFTAFSRAFPPQIAKLIPRLASDHDGEVVATARAIGRLLTSAGLDWHALADLPATRAPIFEVNDLDEATAPAEQRPPSAPAPPKPREPGWSDLRRSEQLALCDRLLAEAVLDEKSRRLVAEVREKLYLGQNFYLAPRHKRLLTALFRTAPGKAAA